MENMEEKDVFYYFYDHEKRNGIPGKEGIQMGRRHSSDEF
nr:MAG TPA: hypothetical protein [Caudoviricetes sp.]